jgi:hypothetical protein
MHLVDVHILIAYLHVMCMHTHTLQGAGGDHMTARGYLSSDTLCRECCTGSTTTNSGSTEVSVQLLSVVGRAAGGRSSVSSPAGTCKFRLHFTPSVPTAAASSNATASEALSTDTSVNSATAVQEQVSSDEQQREAAAVRLQSLARQRSAQQAVADKRAAAVALAEQQQQQQQQQQEEAAAREQERLVAVAAAIAAAAAEAEARQQALLAEQQTAAAVKLQALARQHFAKVAVHQTRAEQ